MPTLGISFNDFNQTDIRAQKRSLALALGWHMSRQENDVADRSNRSINASRATVDCTPQLKAAGSARKASSKPRGFPGTALMSTCTDFTRLHDHSVQTSAGECQRRVAPLLLRPTRLLRALDHRVFIWHASRPRESGSDENRHDKVTPHVLRTIDATSHQT